MSLRRIASSMHTTDVLLIAWAVFLSAINIVFSGRVPHWRVFLVLNTASILFIIVLAAARERSGSRIVRVIHDWYIAPAVFLTFKQLYYLIKPIHLGADYDDWLIAADRWLFGVDPTVWLYRFSHPVLTEVLMIAYTLFYLLFLLIGYEFYRRNERGDVPPVHVHLRLRVPAVVPWLLHAARCRSAVHRARFHVAGPRASRDSG